MKDMLAELLEVNRAVLRVLENNSQIQQTPLRSEMMLGSVDDVVQRYKSLGKQSRAAGKQKKTSA
jgi:hypothetical protein